jgi:RNA polymerase sigma factor (sigma-70 family)
VNSLTDQELLRQYSGRHSEAAFAELARRHVDFVYSAALRMVHDPHLAEDVTQAVFLALAHNAGRLGGCSALSGWLHGTARNIGANTVRTEARRRVREQEAAAMNVLLAPDSDVAWDQIAPHVDTALGELNEADRDAVLLRFFERKSAREIAQTLNISEEAAQKRVSRAMERLRNALDTRGVAVGASGLAALILANAVQTAPAGLAVTISSTSLVGTTIAITTLQKTLVTAALAAAAATGFYEARQASILRSQVQTLHQQQTSLAEQLEQLRQERDDASKQLAMSRDENARLNWNTAELLKLRGEVTRLRELERQQVQIQNGNLATNEPGKPRRVAFGTELQDMGATTPERAATSLISSCGFMIPVGR